VPLVGVAAAPRDHAPTEAASGVVSDCGCAEAGDADVSE